MDMLGHPQGVVWPGGGKAATGQAQDEVGRQCSSRRHITGVRDWQAAVLDARRWKDLVEAAVQLQVL